MKVRVDISAEYKESYAVIYTEKLTQEISDLAQEISGFQSSQGMLLGNLEDRIVILKPEAHLQLQRTKMKFSYSSSNLSPVKRH